ncbi:MAG TPA: thioredoxin domain-containing protein, partial [Candidatus Krumholzibacterium sp.]|nr:thioredoxin domain-containing protein [Candidatus Krumholzibacterium sp.]
RLLGLETRPGEPAPLSDADFEIVSARTDRNQFIYFFHLWCSSCQVMGGLLNEVGPEYSEKADFYKLDVTKNPDTASKFRISGVPTVVAIRNGQEIDRQKGLIPIDELKSWIEETLEPENPSGTGDPGSEQ